MKNQRMKMEARNSGFFSIAVVLLMIATLICSFTVMSSAAGTEIEVALSDLDLSALKLDASTGHYYKVYDGNDKATVAIKTNADLGIAAGDDVTVVPTATFNSENVKEATYITVSFELKGVDKDKYQTPDSITFPASIRPKALEWATVGTASVTYQPGKTTYEGLTVTGHTLKTAGVVSGDTVSVVTTAPTVTVNGVKNAGSYTASAVVALTGADKDNYTIGALNVNVTVGKITITEIKWANDYTFQWGDSAAEEIVVEGYDKAGTAYKLVVEYPANYGTVGNHLITVKLPDTTNMEWAQNNTANTQKQVVITKKQYTVGMDNATYIGNEGVQETPTVFDIAVNGEIPADIRAQIAYTVNGAAFNGTSAYGKYEVVATLPTNANYEFVNASGEVVTSLTATLAINKQYVAAGTADAPYQLILIGENGFAGDITASVSIPEQISRKALRGFRVHTEYTLTVNGAGDETFTVLVPITDALYHKRCEALTANDIYIYEDATGTMVKASEKTGYTVTIKDGYYLVEGVSGAAAVTFVIAPVYNPHFFLTAPGIALLVLIVLIVIALLFLIGMYLRRIRETEGEGVLIVDTGAEEEAVAPEAEDTVDADAYLAENADNLADALEDQVEAEAEEADTEGVEELVAESMEEVLDSETEETEEAVQSEEDVADAMADEKAEELQDAVEAEDAEAEADEDALRDAVAAAMEDNFNESADATDAVVIVAAEEESDELTVEDFKAVVDAIVSDAMCHTMALPESMLAETEEAVEAETAEAEAVETETTETETVTEDVTEETVAEETVEETATEAVTEEATEETAEETTEIVVEEMSGEDVCAIVAESVAEAFDLVTVDGVTPKAVEGTTMETITDAVKDAADANVPETWTEEMTAAVIEAVVDELADRLLVAAPVEEEAVEAFAVVEEAPATDEDEDDNDNEAEEEEENYGGFGSMPLDFIDAIADADAYAALLEQERNGEVQIVTRYRRSFQSRLIQSQGNVQDYYNILKNALLSYKGVKNRISWNYEAFNRGRAHVAKINAKTKTLYLYLALDPEELKDTKYGIVDVSSKKKYASVPVLMKIKGERKFKYALELIAKLCEEKFELPKLETEEIDYHVPYQTTEELVEAGIVKKMVAGVPVSAYGAESTEEAPVEPASATTEAQEVTFVEPTTAPAVEAAAEEIPADANASTDESKEV